MSLSVWVRLSGPNRWSTREYSFQMRVHPALRKFLDKVVRGGTSSHAGKIRCMQERKRRGEVQAWPSSDGGAKATWSSSARAWASSVGVWASSALALPLNGTAPHPVLNVDPRPWAQCGIVVLLVDACIGKEEGRGRRENKRLACGAHMSFSWFHFYVLKQNKKRGHLALSQPNRQDRPVSKKWDKTVPSYHVSQPNTT